MCDTKSAEIRIIHEFTYTEGLTISAVTIAAEIAPANRANTVGTYAELNPEFEGIKRRNSFRYFEEINTLLSASTIAENETKPAKKSQVKIEKIFM